MSLPDFIGLQSSMSTHAPEFGIRKNVNPHRTFDRPRIDLKKLNWIPLMFFRRQTWEKKLEKIVRLKIPMKLKRTADFI